MDSVSDIEQYSQAALDVVRQRIRAGKLMLVIIGLVSAIFVFSNSERPFSDIAMIAAPLALVIGFIMMLNIVNSRQLRPWYRNVNRLIYIQFARLSAGLSILNGVSRGLRAVNPLHGMSPNAPSRSRLALDAFESGQSAYIRLSTLSSAGVVEEYYRRVSQRAQSGVARN